ncbi:hypothetical protein TIFTF001_051997 [Ficus carica]|uniref:Phosphoinositide phospholipase C n=2 Tax=Ficus carica TaxID=3494 RepID=A0AA88ECR3_FICCA|nr:hypothetical protein TIFTF001_051995 [Ficus carica]GMN72384.1 hypothetical protein TIFTF001_051997 [Ficus carica]
MQVHHDMNAPLSHYYLFTGHNSYLTGNQLSSKSSVDPIIKALKRGVRYHVVITFEDHLSSHLQAKVAKMVTKTFGDMLYCPKSDYLLEFPSPGSLKKRVLISTKPPEYRNSRHGRNNKQKQDQDHSEDEKNSGNKAPDNKWLADAVKVRRLSLSEQELENAAKTHGTDIVRFTQKNFLRVYPKGTRLNSSNYNPMLGWMHGAQMVAFNMQVRPLFGICCCRGRSDKNFNFQGDLS